MDNSSSTDDKSNIQQAIRISGEIATRIASLKRRCFDFKVLAPIELSQRSHVPSLPVGTSHTFGSMSKFTNNQKELIIKELSCRLNIQGLTVEQFFTGRIEISEPELVVILINKLKYPNQFSARRAARLFFEMTICDNEEKRQIDDILFEFRRRLECSSYSRSTGKQLFQKLRLKIRGLFYGKIVNKKPIDYQALSSYLFSEGLDQYQINQLLSYILECSPSSTFHWLELQPIVLREVEPDKKKDKYEKKESILTKSSDDPEVGFLGSKTQIEQISFRDCEIEVIEPDHEPHLCGVYSYMN